MLLAAFFPRVAAACVVVVVVAAAVAHLQVLVHPWFDTIDWAAIEAKAAPAPPFVKTLGEYCSSSSDDGAPGESAEDPFAGF